MKIPAYIQNTNQGNYQELLNEVLQLGLSNSGWTVPNLTTAQITSVQASMPLGTLWYDTTLNKLVVKTASGIETITST